VRLKLSGAHNLLFYVDDVNLFGDNSDTTKKNTDALTDANKEVNMEVNTEQTKYILFSRHQNAGQNHDIKIANTASENVTKLRYLGMIETHQNLIHEEIKSM
jgi:hypothetical protein